MLRDCTGKISMMRVGFAVSLVIGAAMCLAAIAGMFLVRPDAVAMGTAGATMITASGFAKSIQKRWEGKKNANTTSD